MKLERKNTEIRSQAHEMWAEGAAYEQPTAQEVVDHVKEYGYSVHEHTIEIWFDTLQKVWIWNCDIFTPTPQP